MPVQGGIAIDFDMFFKWHGTIITLERGYIHLFHTESSFMPSNEIFEVALIKVSIVVYYVSLHIANPVC